MCNGSSLKLKDTKVKCMDREQLRKFVNITDVAVNIQVRLRKLPTQNKMERLQRSSKHSYMEAGRRGTNDEMF